MTLRENERRPGVGTEAAEVSLAGDAPMVARSNNYLADVDAVAQHLSGRFVVQVVIDAEKGHRRTNVYRSCAAAERAVKRARERGQAAHVSLVQMLPVGVVVGLGGGR